MVEPCGYETADPQELARHINTEHFADEQDNDAAPVAARDSSSGRQPREARSADIPRREEEEEEEEIGVVSRSNDNGSSSPGIRQRPTASSATTASSASAGPTMEEMRRARLARFQKSS